jgi:hypothetical protein
MEAEVTAIEQRARQTRWTLAIRWSVRGRGEFVLVGMAAILGFPLGDFKAIFPLGHFGEGGGREKEERSSMVAAATSDDEDVAPCSLPLMDSITIYLFPVVNKDTSKWGKRERQ